MFSFQVGVRLPHNYHLHLSSANVKEAIAFEPLPARCAG
jgi:hypothetical protein